MDDKRLQYLKDDKSQSLSQDIEQRKINVKFDIVELSLICSYVISENKAIKHSGLINIRKALNVINTKVYIDDPESMKRIYFIKKALIAKLDKNLYKRDLVLRDIAGGMGVSERIEDYPEINTDEIKWVDSSISELLKYSHIQSESDEGIDILTNLNSSEYATRGDIVDRLNKWVSKVHNKFRIDSIEAAEDLTFSLEDGKLQNVLRETHRQVTAPQNVLKFGVQALNAITGGGVYAKRVYVILGLPGEGKSATLLDMAIQLKKYNTTYQCKDPTKKPCILLINMENDTAETVERMFAMMIQRKISDFSEEEAVSLFMNHGLVLSKDSPVNLVIKYKQGMSEDTSYIDTLIDNLSDDGFEVICVLLDYLKRIRSRYGSFKGDLRLELGSIVNELKIIATANQIPIITASQLNRTATSNIDSARMRNKTDLVKVLGRSNVAESNLILENADWIAQIAPEKSVKDGTRYLGIQCIKRRYADLGKFNSAFMPYVGDTIKLVEDFGLQVPVHKDTLNLEGPELNNGMSANIIGATNGAKEFVMNGSINMPAMSNGGINIFDGATDIMTYNMDKTKKVFYRLITPT